MYLDIVIIDILEPNGVLRTYKIRPKELGHKVVIDRLQDIYPDKYDDDDFDLGGTRIYNSSSCIVERQTARLRSFEANERKISFQFDHIGIPLGPSKQAHGGIYNFLLSPGWRLTEVYVSDPYDTKKKGLKDKKQFSYSAGWDTECNVQLIDMQLRSSRGSFSFVVSGTAELVGEQSRKFVEARESDWVVSNIVDNHLIDKNGKAILAQDIADKSDWLELKPNILALESILMKLLKTVLHYSSKKFKVAETPNKENALGQQKAPLLRRYDFYCR